MKLSISKGEFLTGLARLQGIVEKRNSMPILANVLIRATVKGDEPAELHLAATDLEVGIQSSHEAKVNKAGFKTHSHADYEPGRRFYFHDGDNIEFEVVSYQTVPA